ncbi:hypothetical protein EGW08_018462 [Elysia chlorotica]|uniref:G-protein coupled receptors family 1 profile domain-containing protein n=1 Tax=Elysia chlorotica TaxID=188477 RepID=A0A3S1AW32_ELYCH|nr:hypothetical protein EGW08_018462 [Elysia chlorotica]
MNVSTASPNDVTISLTDGVQNGIGLRNTMMGMIGSAANLIAIIFLSLSKRVRPTLKITLLSMSFNDFVFMLSIIFLGLSFECWPILFIVAGSILVSYFITTSIALHNYVAVFYPLRCRHILSMKRSLILVVVCWVAGYGTALAFLGVRLPADKPCFLLVMISRACMVVYSFMCLFCCFLVTVSSVKILACIRGRFRQNVIRPLRSTKEHGSSADVSMKKNQSKTGRVSMWPFRACAVVAPLQKPISVFTGSSLRSKMTTFASSAFPRSPNRESASPALKLKQMSHVKRSNIEVDPALEHNQPTSQIIASSKCTKLIEVRPAWRQNSYGNKSTTTENSSWTTGSLQCKTFNVRPNIKPRAHDSDKTYLKVPPTPGLKPTNSMETYRAFNSTREHDHKGKSKQGRNDISQFSEKHRASYSTMSPGGSGLTLSDYSSSEGFMDNEEDHTSVNTEESSQPSKQSEKLQSQCLEHDNGNLSESINTLLAIPVHMGCRTENKSNKILEARNQNQNSFSPTISKVSPSSGVSCDTDIAELSVEGKTANSKGETKPYVSGYQQVLVNSGITNDDEELISTIELIDSSDEERKYRSDDLDDVSSLVSDTRHSTIRQPISTVQPLTLSQANQGMIAPDFEEHLQFEHSKRLSSGLQYKNKSLRKRSGDSSKNLYGNTDISNEIKPAIKTPAAKASIVDKSNRKNEVSNSIKTALKSKSIQEEDPTSSRAISIISSRGITPVNVVPNPSNVERCSDKAHPSESFQTDSSTLSYSGTSDQNLLNDTPAPTNRRTPTLTRHQRVKEGTRWNFRTQYTLLIICGWCCLLSLPYVVYATYVAIWVENRSKFQGSSVGMLCSSLVGLNSITNPLLYAWRFVEWRDIWRRIRRATSRR